MGFEPSLKHVLADVPSRLTCRTSTRPQMCGGGPLMWGFTNRPGPEPLSQAAMEVLSIVVCEQPIARAEISHIRGTESSGVIETLLARRLIEDDPRFGGRGRPSFLATAADFLR